MFADGGWQLASSRGRLARHKAAAASGLHMQFLRTGWPGQNPCPPGSCIEQGGGGGREKTGGQTAPVCRRPTLPAPGPLARPAAATACTPQCVQTYLGVPLPSSSAAVQVPATCTAVRTQHKCNARRSRVHVEGLSEGMGEYKHACRRHVKAGKFHGG